MSKTYRVCVYVAVRFNMVMAACIKVFQGGFSFPVVDKLLLVRVKTFLFAPLLMSEQTIRIASDPAVAVLIIKS